MKKTILGFFAVSAVLLILAGLYVSVPQSEPIEEVNQVKSVSTSTNNHSSTEEQSNLSSTPSFLSIKESPSKESNRLESTISECVEIPEKQAGIYTDQVDDFANDIVLHSFSVHEYLTTLQEHELIAEFEAGNASAAYVLGMNHFFSSYNKGWFNPLLSKKAVGAVSKQTPMDKDKLQLAREWLWKAALNGVSVALLELGSTYEYEKDFLERDYKNNLIKQADEVVKSRLVALEVKAVSYHRLSEEVAPDMYDVFGPTSTHFRKQFEAFSAENKETIYKAINEDWDNERLEGGKDRMVELEVPENIKKAILEMQKRCIE